MTKREKILSCLLVAILALAVVAAKPLGISQLTSLWIGDATATADVTPGANDLYVNGTSEFDGAMRVDSTLAVSGAATLSGGLTFSGEILTPTEVVTAANVITAAECGKTFFLNAGTAIASTLPAVSGVSAGCEFEFIIQTASTGGNHTIITGNSLENVLYGGIIELETDTNDDGPSVSAGDTITFTDTPNPGVGSFVRLRSNGSAYFLTGVSHLDGGITPSQAD